MKLIEKLEQLSDEYLNLYTDYGDRADLNCSGAVDEAINIVKQHSDWVPVSERLPENNVFVLVWLKSGYSEVLQKWADWLDNAKSKS